MNIRNFKSNITKIPNYLDGYLNVYELETQNEVFPIKKFKLKSRLIPFEEVSIYDRLRLESNQKDMRLSHKLRLAEDRTINSLNLIELEDGLHSIFNIIHFKNKNGFVETELTLIKVEKDVILID